MACAEVVRASAKAAKAIDLIMGFLPDVASRLPKVGSPILDAMSGVPACAWLPRSTKLTSRNLPYGFHFDVRSTTTVPGGNGFAA